MKTKIALPLCLLLFTSTLIIQSDLIQKLYFNSEVNPQCRWCDNEKVRDDIVFIPLNASALRLVAPADSGFLADLLWIRTAYYFGRHALTDRQYPYMFHLLDLITDLSPFWILPYQFAAVILPTEIDNVDDGMYFITKGLIYHPTDWRLWFFKGFYLWKFQGDTISAAESIHQASLMPEAPVFIARLAATFATRAGQRELAIRFLDESMSHIKDPKQRSILSEKLKEMLNGD